MKNEAVAASSSSVQPPMRRNSKPNNLQRIPTRSLSANAGFVNSAPTLGESLSLGNIVAPNLHYYNNELDNPPATQTPAAVRRRFPNEFIPDAHNKPSIETTYLPPRSNGTDRRSSLLASPAPRSNRPGSAFYKRLVTYAFCFVAALCLLYASLTPLTNFISTSSSHKKAAWQLEFDALRQQIDLQNNVINQLHSSKQEIEMRAKEIHQAKALADDQITALQKDMHEISRKAEKLEKQKAKAERKLSHVSKQEDELDVDGVGIWKPKPLKKKAASKRPDQKLVEYVEHHGSTKDGDDQETFQPHVDERNTYLDEASSGINMNEKKQDQRSNEPHENDASIAAVRHALKAERMRHSDGSKLTDMFLSEDDDSAEDFSNRKDLRWTPEPNDVSPIRIFPMLPSSNVYCQGTSRESRICKFRNLCYQPSIDKWFIAQTNRSIQQNVPLHRHNDGLLELTSAAGHSSYFWDFDEISPFGKQFRNMKVRYEHDTHFMFQRLHPNNVMHQLHDDVIGLYHMLKEYLGGGSITKDEDFSMGTHRIMVLDMYEKTHASRIYDYLSSKPTRYRDYLNLDKEVTTCFRDAVLGSSKVATWYQYGFKGPQSPIPGKTPNGNLVREVTEFFVRKLDLPLGIDEHLYLPIIDHADPMTNGRLEGNLKSEVRSDASKYDKSVDFPETDLTIIMSRKHNRKMTNEDELASHLEASFGYKVVIVSNEEHTFVQQVKFLRRARILVGMHGSILVMSMFCRRGTVLLEMFPYAVPSQDYTPYKTMAELPGMNIIYKAWENKIESNSIAYPDRHPLHGGLGELSIEDRQSVLDTKRVPPHKCCASPYWLYRIYQDTTISLSEITLLLHEGLAESRSILGPIKDGTWNPGMTELLPPLIDDITCLESNERPPGELWAEWSPPWNGAAISMYSIHVNNNGREYESKGPIMAIPGFEPGEEVVFFVRPEVGKYRGEYRNVGRCVV